MDLLVLAAIDQLFSFVTVLLSGGLNTPYYHVSLTSLLIPAFLLGWRAAPAPLLDRVGQPILGWDLG